jgi:hypothetical protein
MLSSDPGVGSCFQRCDVGSEVVLVRSLSRMYASSPPLQLQTARGILQVCPSESPISIEKSFHKYLFDHLTFSFRRGDKIAYTLIPVQTPFHITDISIRGIFFGSNDSKSDIEDAHRFVFAISRVEVMRSQRGEEGKERIRDR